MSTNAVATLDLAVLNAPESAEAEAFRAFARISSSRAGPTRRA